MKESSVCTTLYSTYVGILFSVHLIAQTAYYIYFTYVAVQTTLLSTMYIKGRSQRLAAFYMNR